MDSFETIERAGYTASIVHDVDPQSPDEWDTFAKLAYNASRVAWNPDDLPRDPYGTGRFVVDCDQCEGTGERDAPEGIQQFGKPSPCAFCEGTGYRVDGLQACQTMHGNVVACLPVSVNDGPYTMLHVADDWEDAQGWIYATKETADMTGVAPADYEKALRQDLATWNTYLEGDVYGIIVTDADGREVDSCFGFYGLEYAREEAKGMLDTEPVRLLEKYPALRDLRVT